MSHSLGKQGVKLSHNLAKQGVKLSHNLGKQGVKLVPTALGSKGLNWFPQPWEARG